MKEITLLHGEIVIVDDEDFDFLNVNMDKEGWDSLEGNFWKNKPLESTSSIPVFGKFYYWWFGKGEEKSRVAEVKQLKEKYYKTVSEEIKKFGDVTQETVNKVIEDKRLSEKDKTQLEERLEVNDELVYSVKHMPFEKALRAFKQASDEEKQKLLEVLDDKYERLSDEDKAKFDPKIDEIMSKMKVLPAGSI